MALPACSEEELTAIYVWVDEVPLSRPKKSISRDFADGVLMAELVHHYFPKLVELHNYSPAHNSVQKLYNWSTLNQKVFRRLGFALAREQQEAVANAEAGAIERVLKLVRSKMARFQESAAGGSPRHGSADVAAAGSAAPAGSHTHAAPPAVASPSGSIAALRLAAGVPSWQERPASAADPGGFPGLDQAAAAHLAEQAAQLEELRETNVILETKIAKLEQLVRLKDAKIQALLAKLQTPAT